MSTLEKLAKSATWYCDFCEKAGLVYPEDLNDLVAIAVLVQSDHQATSPECTNVRFKQKDAFTRLNWRTELPQWAVAEIDAIIGS